ncbi:MAG: hypothetical protein EPN97_10885 [Alphaproteobacteria bacterium]|nr:MAG: hypothetical protein EPN97_10885 [Alphaproteobacteria bacterium]
MKETPLNKAFSDALRRVGEDRHMKNVARQLQVMQQTVAEFHEAGIPVTLAVRPERTGFPAAMGDNADGRVLVNGTIDAGDARLDFVIQKARFRDDKMELIICHDGCQLMNRASEYDGDTRAWEDEKPDREDTDGGDEWDRRVEEDDWSEDGPDPYGASRSKAKKPRPPSDLKDLLSALIIDVKAKADFVTKYNVGPNGFSDTSIEKPFSVAPPLKLKNAPKP